VGGKPFADGGRKVRRIKQGAGEGAGSFSVANGGSFAAAPAHDAWPDGDGGGVEAHVYSPRKSVGFADVSRRCARPQGSRAAGGPVAVAGRRAWAGPGVGGGRTIAGLPPPPPPRPARPRAHRLWALAWPLAWMEVLTFAKELIITGFVGRLGALELSALVLAQTLYNVTGNAPCVFWGEASAG
jgi:hypothetical protein